VFVLQLGHTDFNDTAACLGPQVASVLDALIALPELSGVAWYAASVDAIAPPVVREALANYETDECPISDVQNFVSLVHHTGQLLDGVFFSVPMGQEPIVAVKLLTADGQIKKLVANSLVQVCAFDTTWIEIGSDIPILIERMQGRFGGKMLQSNDNE
jgi:hypothetical protein